MSPEARRGLRRYGWLIASLTTLVAMSFLPMAWKVRMHTHGRYHLPGHFAAFAFCGLLAFRSAEGMADRLRRTIALLAVGLTLEAGQWLVFGNTFEIPDVQADAAGTFVALCASQLSAARQRLTARR